MPESRPGAHISSTLEAMSTIIQGPPSLPIIGNLPAFANNPLNFLFASQRDYGDVFTYAIASNRVVLAAHPDDVKHILLDNHKNYEKHAFYKRVKPLVGEGLLTSEGDTWFKNRRLAQPVFHRQHIHSFGEMMTTSTQTMLESRWQNRVDNSEPLDVHHEMMHLTLVIVAQALFSKDLSDEADDVSQALNFSLEHINKRSLSPIELPESLPTPGNAKFARALKTLDEVIYSLIKERRNSGETPENNRGDLLSMLLHASDIDTGESMSDLELRDEAMTLFLAGHETSANALTWLFYLLAQHVSVADKIRTELNEVLDGRAPSVEDAPKLVYTRQVIDETLRLYPPAWMIGRHSLGTDTLPSGATLPAGTDVSISPYVIHRHQDFWDNPEGFDPERFSKTRSEGRHRFAYFPFGAGPRMCIGNNFALLEMTLAVATIMQSVRLELLSGQTIKPQPSVTLRPKDSVLMRVKPR